MQGDEDAVLRCQRARDIAVASRDASERGGEAALGASSGASQIRPEDQAALGTGPGCRQDRAVSGADHVMSGVPGEAAGTCFTAATTCTGAPGRAAGTSDQPANSWIGDGVTGWAGHGGSGSCAVALWVPLPVLTLVLLLCRVRGTYRSATQLICQACTLRAVRITLGRMLQITFPYRCPFAK